MNVFTFNDARICDNACIRRGGFCVDPTMHTAALLVFSEAFPAVTAVQTNHPRINLILNMNTVVAGAEPLLKSANGKYGLYVQSFNKPSAGRFAARNDMLGVFENDAIETILPSHYEVRVLMTDAAQAQVGYTIHNGKMVSNGIRKSHEFVQQLHFETGTEPRTLADFEHVRETDAPKRFATPIAAVSMQLCDFTWAKQPSAFSPYFYHGFYTLSDSAVKVVFVQNVLEDEDVILCDAAHHALYADMYTKQWTCETLRAHFQTKDMPEDGAPYKRQRVESVAAPVSLLPDILSSDGGGGSSGDFVDIPPALCPEFFHGAGNPSPTGSFNFEDLEDFNLDIESFP